jgi:hypothetical protein
MQGDTAGQGPVASSRTRGVSHRSVQALCETCFSLHISIGGIPRLRIGF